VDRQEGGEGEERKGGREGGRERRTYHQMLVLQQAFSLDLNELPSEIAVFLRGEHSLVLRALGVRALVLGLPVVDAL